MGFLEDAMGGAISMPGGLGGIFGNITSMIALNSAGTILILLVVIAATWALVGFKWLYIGRKAGLDNNWMPFVPIAKALYRLKIVDEQWWKVFFLEDWWLYSFLLFRIIMAISANNWFSFATILVSIYLISCIAYNIYWRYKYYIAFAIQPHMAITILVPLSGMVRSYLDYQVAFTENFDYGGTATTTTISSGAKNFVNVEKPSNNQSGTITGMSGMYAGQSIPLASNVELLIGRDSSCNLIIDKNSSKLSRRHCGIVFDPARGVYMVTDYSSNGTYIDGGTRLATNVSTPLQRGSIIDLGNRENRFRLN